jgi:hypothetical protein
MMITDDTARRVLFALTALWFACLLALLAGQCFGAELKPPSPTLPIEKAEAYIMRHPDYQHRTAIRVCVRINEAILGRPIPTVLNVVVKLAKPLRRQWTIVPNTYCVRVRDRKVTHCAYVCDGLTEHGLGIAMLELPKQGDYYLYVYLLAKNRFEPNPHIGDPVTSRVKTRLIDGARKAILKKRRGLAVTVEPYAFGYGGTG